VGEWAMVRGWTASITTESTRGKSYEGVSMAQAQDFWFFFGTYLIGQLCRVKYVDALWAVFFGCLVLGRDIGVSRSNQNLSFLSHIKAKVIGISSHYRHRHDARGTNGFLRQKCLE
jgi:hypothetical protein